MDHGQEDPYDWSVDQVVHYLCRNESTPWSVSKHPSPLPDRKSLEIAIREHGITGEVLLEGHLEDFLRNSLKLKEGPFYTVKKAIQYAQRLSQKYRAQQAQERSQLASTMFPMMMNNDRAWSNHFNAPWIFNPLPAAPAATTTQIPQLTAPSIPPTSSDNGHKLANKQLLSIVQVPQPPSSPQIAELDDVGSPHTPAGNGKRPSSFGSRIATPTSPNLRPNEASHIDGRGRKRRRLDLTVVESSTTLPTKRPAEIQNPGSWYLGPTKIDAASVFYPITSDSNEDDWSISSSGHSSGQKLFVKRKMHIFFRKTVIDLPSRNGARRYAMFPYDEDEVNNSKPRYYTLYTSHKGRTDVSMKSTADSTEELPAVLQQATRAKVESPYDLLLKKYPPKEESDSYPLFGESGSEGAYDSETWAEIEDENEGASKPCSFLSSQTIDAIIDERIYHYEKLWKANYLPRLESRAHKLWLNATRKKCRNLQIKDALDNIQRLKSRLGKLRKALHNDEWTKPPSLKSQCEVLEQTVFEIETQKHRVAILESPQCPPKRSSLPRPAPQPKDKVIPPLTDEESLGFESDGSLRNFIEYDMDIDVPSGPSNALPQSHSNSKSPVMPNIKSTQERSTSPIKIGDSPAREATPQNNVLHNDGSEADPGFEAVARPRCGFYYSSDSNSDSEYEPPEPVSRFIGRKSEIIDLTGSPANSDISSARGIRSAKTEIFSTPGTRAVETENHQDVSDDVMVVISPPQKFYSVSKTSPRPNPKFDRRTDARKKNGGTPPQTIDGVPRQILDKMVSKLSKDEQTRVFHWLSSWTADRQIKHRIKMGLHALRKDTCSFRDMEPEESKSLLQATTFYIAWVNRQIIKKDGIDKTAISRALADIERQGAAFSDDFIKFLSHLRQLLQKHTAEPTSLSTGDSDDDEPMDSVDTPHKKRKRRVKEDQAVKSGQVAARQRVENQERQRRNLEERLKRIGVSNSDAEHQAVSFEQPTVFLHPHIGQCVKPHQLAGIQFMWRELIQNEKRDGCLLAHTMGLGKTMQVISLLVTIAAAANSPDEDIRKQVPKFFHRSQTLILCPPSLIDNWYEEFLMWTPKDHALGPIRKVAPSDPLERRMSIVESWDAEGGILILSYFLFRNWVAPELQKKSKIAPEMHFPTKLKDQLLKGPRIIVADEAHQMKNKDSQLAQAAAMLESRSRIALTGSPLANNLIDYYAMVNWISPKYLDELAVFKAKYLEPIEQGLFFDSTYQEQRRSLKKLQVLKQILTPKINRADISVLEGSLPSKTEFVITVPLTEVQKRAYNHYVTSLTDGRMGAQVSSTRFLAWLAVLGLCCNHPACFANRLAERAEDHARKPTSEELIDPDTSPAEVPLEQLGFNEAMWASQKQLLSSFPNLEDPKHSYRAQIFKKIVEESVRVGDKILCFSLSIPTLDYLETLLRSSGVRFNRLDGKTAVKSRQEAVKDFNNRDDIKVYLISTRAGGLGLNITGANRVIIFDFSFNPTWEEQAVGRAYRLGQKKPVYIYRFLSGGTYEEVVHNKSIFKTQLAMRVVDKKNVDRSATKSLGEYLFPVKDVKKEDLSEYIGRDRQVLDKILLDKESASSSILNIALTETFRRENNEMLTEDEKKEMEQELELELLRMSDPAAYEKKMIELSHRPEPTLVYSSTNYNTSSFNGVPLPPLPPLPPVRPSVHHSFPVQAQIPTAPSPQTARSFFNLPPWATTSMPTPVTQSKLTQELRPTQLPPHPDVISTSTVNCDPPESAAQAILRSFTTSSGATNHQNDDIPSPQSLTEQPSGLPDNVTAEMLTARLSAN